MLSANQFIVLAFLTHRFHRIFHMLSIADSGYSFISRAGDPSI